LSNKTFLFFNDAQQSAKVSFQCTLGTVDFYKKSEFSPSNFTAKLNSN